MSKKNFLKGRRKVEMTFKEAIKTKQNPRDRKQQQQTEQEYRKVRYPVWIRPGHYVKPDDSQTDFEKLTSFQWPEFKTDRERIKAYSQMFRNNPISEAFSTTYNQDINVNPELADMVNNTPTELHVGDVVKMPLLSVSKDNVVFDCMNLKQLVNCNTNLYKYENFRRFIPKEPMRVKVVSASKDKITVDPLTPMLEDWITPISNNPTMQRVLAQPQTIKVKDLKLVSNGGFVGKAVIPNVSDYVGEDYTIEAFIPGSQIVLNIESDFSKWVGKTVDAFVTSYNPQSNRVALICSVKEYLKFLGDQNLIKLFNVWCDADAQWEAQKEKQYDGVVTGILHNSMKCGVFVEIPELHITGMVNMPADELVNYKPQSSVKVKIIDMEEETYFDEAQGKKVHAMPYTVKDGVLENCTIKPVLQFA